LKKQLFLLLFSLPASPRHRERGGLKKQLFLLLFSLLSRWWGGGRERRAGEVRGPAARLPVR